MTVLYNDKIIDITRMTYILLFLMNVQNVMIKIQKKNFQCGTMHTSFEKSPRYHLPKPVLGQVSTIHILGWLTVESEAWCFDGRRLAHSARVAAFRPKNAITVN